MKASAPPAPTPVRFEDPSADDQPKVIEFPAGLPGFEPCRRFVLLTSPDLHPLGCLQSVEPPEASFLVVDPRRLDPEYDMTLREFERARIGAGEESLLWLAIVTLGAESASANLRAPIVINPRRMVGCQFIRDEREYPVRFPIGLG